MPGQTLVAMATLAALAPGNPRGIYGSIPSIDRSIDRSKQRSFFTRSVFSSERHAAARPSLITTPAFSRNISLSGVNSNEEQNKSVAAISRFESRSVCSLTVRIDPARQLLFPVDVAVAIAIAFLIPPTTIPLHRSVSRVCFARSRTARSIKLRSIHIAYIAYT